MTNFIIIMGGANIHGRLLLHELVKNNIKPMAIINESGTKRAQKLSKFLQNEYDNPPMLEEMINPELIYEVDKFDGAQTFEIIEKINPEYIVFGGQGIVKEPLLSTRKPLNIHPGILPDFKGLDPVLWTALAKKTFGATVQIMSEGIDEGDILISKALPWKGAKDLMQLRLQVMRWGGRLLSKFLANPSNFPPIKQNLNEGEYFQSFPEDKIPDAEKNIKHYSECAEGNKFNFKG